MALPATSDSIWRATPKACTTLHGSRLPLLGMLQCFCCTVATDGDAKPCFDDVQYAKHAEHMRRVVGALQPACVLKTCGHVG